MNVAPLFSLLYIVGYCDMVKLIISRLRGGCQNYIIAKNAVAPYFFCKDTIFSCKWGVVDDANIVLGNFTENLHSGESETRNSAFLNLRQARKP